MFPIFKAHFLILIASHFQTAMTLHLLSAYCLAFMGVGPTHHKVGTIFCVIVCMRKLRLQKFHQSVLAT